MVYCCVPYCSERQNNNMRGLSFHKFPLDPLLRLRWLRTICRANWTPNDSTCARVCSKHFLESDFVYFSTGRVRLKPDVVPTVFPHYPAYLQRRAEQETLSNRLKRLRKKNRDYLEFLKQNPGRKTRYAGFTSSKRTTSGGSKKVKSEGKNSKELKNAFSQISSTREIASSAVSITHENASSKMLIPQKSVFTSECLPTECIFSEDSMVLVNALSEDAITFESSECSTEPDCSPMSIVSALSEDSPTYEVSEHSAELKYAHMAIDNAFSTTAFDHSTELECVSMLKTITIDRAIQVDYLPRNNNLQVSLLKKSLYSKNEKCHNLQKRCTLLEEKLDEYQNSPEVAAFLKVLEVAKEDSENSASYLVNLVNNFAETHQNDSDRFSEYS